MKEKQLRDEIIQTIKAIKNVDILNYIRIIVDDIKKEEGGDFYKTCKN